MRLKAATSTRYRARSIGRACSFQARTLSNALARLCKLWIVCNTLLACSVAQATAGSAAQRYPDPRREVNSFLQRGRTRAALRAIETNKDRLDPVDFYLLSGAAYTLELNVVKAREEFETAVRLAPQTASVHGQYGVSLMKLAEFGDARKELTEALVLDPQSAEFHFSLGLLDGREGNPADADEEIRQAIELTHDTTRLRSYFTIDGQMLLLAHSWSPARDAFEKAISLNRANAAAWAGLGEALSESNSTKDSVAALKKAVVLDPKNAVAFDHLGEAEMRLDDYAEAAAAYRRANALRPGNRAVLYHLVRALTMSGREQEAEQFEAQLKILVEKEAALNKQGLDLVSINEEAISLERKGDYSAAEADYRREVEIDPTNPIFRRNLGLVLCRQEKWDDGLLELREALELNPDDVESAKALNAAITINNNKR